MVKRSYLRFCLFVFTTLTSSTLTTANTIHHESLVQKIPNRNLADKELPTTTAAAAATTDSFRTNPSNKIIRGGANKKQVNEPEPSSSSNIKKINPHVAILYGMILAFNSGLINGVTLTGILSSIKQPSSAVTGSWTNSALAMAGSMGQMNLAESTFYMFNNLALQCIYAYMGGSFVAGLFNPYPINYTMKRNTIRPSFLIASLSMYLSYVFVTKHNNDGSGTAWILFAVFANGIQNSITSSMTSNLMRTAHYSGITSDMGTFIGQSMRGNKANGLKLKLFYVLGPCFWYGGFFSLGLTKAMGSKVLLISCLLYLIFGIFSI